MSQDPHKPQEREQDIDRLARQESGGIIGEILAFLRHTRKWWLTPIILVLLLIGVLVVLSGTAAAPFIYTLF